MSKKNPNPITDEDEQINDGVKPHLFNAFSLGLTVVLLISLFVVENPTSGGPRIVIAALVLIFALLFQIIWLSVKLFAKLRGGNLVVRHPFLLSQLIALSGIFLIGLLSLNQLSITDVILTIVLVTMIYLYIIRRF
ncbi:hypothetical protein H6800_01860 [Candidatus Nomurabacteria bacterium]|nr:hypothetical protein [Candidatus Nomurabacteria bacterium]